MRGAATAKRATSEGPFALFAAHRPDEDDICPVAVAESRALAVVRSRLEILGTAGEAVLEVPVRLSLRAEFPLNLNERRVSCSPRAWRPSKYARSDGRSLANGVKRSPGASVEYHSNSGSRAKISSSPRRSPLLNASRKRPTRVSTSSAVQRLGCSGSGGGAGTRVGTPCRAKMRSTRAGAIRGTDAPLTGRSTTGGCDPEAG